jgi:hypothetical protein
VVKAVPPAEYDAWLAQARQRFAADQGAPAPVVAQTNGAANGVTTVAELSR